MPKHDKRGSERERRRTMERYPADELLFDKHDGAEELDGEDRDSGPHHRIRRSYEHGHSSSD